MLGFFFKKAFFFPWIQDHFGVQLAAATQPSVVVAAGIPSGQENAIFGETVREKQDSKNPVLPRSDEQTLRIVGCHCINQGFGNR